MSWMELQLELESSRVAFGAKCQDGRIDRWMAGCSLQAMETPFAAVVLSLLTQLHNLRHLFIDLDAYGSM
ncbi:GM20805 [Drosophila sechellia]|uniref:GM20805 n=1 Tax=Drosophila sechellia TaxID=7238 RepID=B4HQS8_DROSE|nr:GM20805 [Drosophila sechellia]